MESIHRVQSTFGQYEESSHSANVDLIKKCESRYKKRKASGHIGQFKT